MNEKENKDEKIIVTTSTDGKTGFMVCKTRGEEEQTCKTITEEGQEATENKQASQQTESKS